MYLEIMSSTENKKSNPLFEVIFNVFLPSFILMKFSGDEHLGTGLALIVALAFPIAYGGMELIRNKKFNFIAAEFLHVLAADACRRLCQNFHSRTVCESTLCFANRTSDKLLETFPQKSRQVLIHS